MTYDDALFMAAWLMGFLLLIFATDWALERLRAWLRSADPEDDEDDADDDDPTDPFDHRVFGEPVGFGLVPVADRWHN